MEARLSKNHVELSLLWQQLRGLEADVVAAASAQGLLERHLPHECAPPFRVAIDRQGLLRFLLCFGSLRPGGVWLRLLRASSFAPNASNEKGGDQTERVNGSDHTLRRAPRSCVLPERTVLGMQKPHRAQTVRANDGCARYLEGTDWPTAGSKSPTWPAKLVARHRQNAAQFRSLSGVGRTAS